MSRQEKSPNFSSRYNFVNVITKKERISADLILNDITLREGEQTADVALSVDDKVTIARKLEEIGIEQIQVGFGLADKEAIIKCKKELQKAQVEAVVLAFLDSWKAEIDSAVEAGADILHIMIRTQDEHLLKLRMTKEIAIRRAVDAITYAKNRGIQFVTISPTFSTRSDLYFLRDFCKETVQSGADRLCVNDTTGVLKPSAYEYLVRQTKKWVNVPIEVHCHNDFGLATANTLAGIEAGCKIVDVSVNGLGERAGNASLDEVVLALHCLYNVKLKVAYARLHELSSLVEKLTGLQVHKLKPIVGSSVFSQKLDAHVMTTSTDPQLIEPFDPSFVGNKRKSVLGKGTGRYSVRKKVTELGLTIPDEKIDEVVKEINNLAISKKRALSDDEFKQLVLKKQMR